MSGTGWIIYALYGAPPTGSNIGFNDVTALVSAQYASGQTVFNANNANYGPDPDAGTFKSMVIVYSYSTATSLASGIYPLNSFQILTATCPENGSITLPAANVPQTGNAEVDAVINSVEGFLDTEPNLPGILSGQAVVATAFEGRSDQDARILAGRLYYDAVQKITASDPTGRTSQAQYSPENIHRSLEQPLSTVEFGKPRFDALMDDTRARMQNDPVFARQINEFSSHATSRVNCRCTVNGVTYPCWVCIIIIVIIIILTT